MSEFSLNVNEIKEEVDKSLKEEEEKIANPAIKKQADENASAIFEANFDDVAARENILKPLDDFGLNAINRVEQAIGLNVQHISAYCLSYERGTRLWVMREQGKVQEASDELCVAMHNTLVTMLQQAGFEHYEISNFARPGFRSRHNSSYWNFTPYLGLGAAAHSFDGTNRRFNPSNIKQYIKSLSENRTVFTMEELEWWERHDEEVMVRLRTSDGLDTTVIAKHYGSNASDTLLRKALPFINQGLLNQKGTILTLTPQGVMMSDHIIRTLMWD